MDAFIDTILGIAKLILWLGLIAGGVIYIFSPSRGRALFIRVFWVAVGLSVAIAALNSLAVSLSGITAGWLLLLLAIAASVIAYSIRAVGRRGTHKPELRGVERTPLVPQHLDGDDDRQ